MGARGPLSGIHRFAHRAMGCEFGIAVAGEKEDYARSACLAAFEVLTLVEAEISRFDPGSDISRINALPPGPWTRVGLETTRCLVAARRAWRITRGHFDPGFRGGGFRRVVLDARRHRVRVRASLTLDLGAIGKGYALDRMGEMLREWGIGSALTMSGASTAVALGPPPRLAASHRGFSGRRNPAAAGWRLGLRHPARPGATVGTVFLRAGAFSGSGIAAQGPHIVDPRTGLPATRPAAWAWAPTGALSDALSTAFMAMNAQEARAACAGVGGGIIAAGSARMIRLTRFGTMPGVTMELKAGGR